MYMKYTYIHTYIYLLLGNKTLILSTWRKATVDGVDM